MGRPVTRIVPTDVQLKVYVSEDQMQLIKKLRDEGGYKNLNQLIFEWFRKATLYDNLKDSVPVITEFDIKPMLEAHLMGICNEQRRIMEGLFNE